MLRSDLDDGDQVRHQSHLPTTMPIGTPATIPMNAAPTPAPDQRGKSGNKGHDGASGEPGGQGSGGVDLPVERRPRDTIRVLPNLIYLL